MLEGLSQAQITSIIQFVFRAHAGRLEASMVKDLQDNNFRATGTAIKSVTSDIEGNTLSILGEDYIEKLDKGQEPGTVARIDDLITWVTAKGLAPAENVESYAYGIQQAIYKRGTIERFNYEGANFIQYIIDQDVPKLVNDLEQRLGEAIEVAVARKINKNK